MPGSSAGRRRGACAGAALISLMIAAIQGGFSPDAAAQARSTMPPLDNGAVVVMYHRFGEADRPSTNIRLDQFEAHIAELTSGPYTVLPVPQIVGALAENRALPDRAVGITIDDAFRSVYTEAWPRLKAAGLPFTLFVSTQALDGALPDYMTWDQLREMVAAGGVTVGNHGVTHGHMVRQSLDTVRAEISEAAKRIEQELGQRPSLFAYPYGEYSLAIRDAVVDAGLAAAFGQHSGAIGRTGDRFGMPRFPLSESYADMERFRLIANALPLPVSDLTPAEPLLSAETNPPLYGFTVAETVSGLGALSCFASRNDLTMERLGKYRVETRMAGPFPPGRARINCTMPGPDGRWRWLGAQFYVRDEERGRAEQADRAEPDSSAN